MSSHYSARARIEARSGAKAGSGAASIMPKRAFDGEKRGSSEAMLPAGQQARLSGTGREDRGHSAARTVGSIGPGP